MKAIQVKYLRPSNFRGSRIKVMAEGVKPITLPFNYVMSSMLEMAHHGASKMCAIYGWNPIGLTHGQLPNGDYVFCFNERLPAITNALELSEATIKRLNRHDSANGTLDVINAALGKG